MGNSNLVYEYLICVGYDNW